MIKRRRVLTGHRLSRGQYRSEMETLRAQWRQFSDDERAIALLDVSRQREATSQRGQQEEDPEKAYAERIGNECWQCSDKTSPVSEVLIQQCVDEVAPATVQTRGLTAALEPVRQAFADTRVVNDQGCCAK